MALELQTTMASRRDPWHSLALLGPLGLAAAGLVLGSAHRLSVECRQRVWMDRRSRQQPTVRVASLVPGRYGRLSAYGFPPFCPAGGAPAILSGPFLALVVWHRRRRGHSVAPNGLVGDQDAADRGQSENMWRSLADQNPMPVLCARGVEVVGANRAAADALGVDRSALMNGHLFDLIAPDDPRAFEISLAAGGQTGPSRHSFPGRLLVGPARDRPVEFEVTVAGGEREALRYVSWWRATPADDWERLLQALAPAVPYPLVFCDAEGNILWSNDAASQRTGYPPSRFRGRSPLPAVEPADWRRARVALGQARRGRIAQVQVRIRSADGELLEADFSAVPVRAGGTIRGVLFAAAELTPQGGASERADAHRDHVLSHLGTSLAHRLRNDLQALLGVLAEREKGGAGDPTLVGVQRLVGDAVEDLRRFVTISRAGALNAREADLIAAVESWFSRARLSLPRPVRATFRYDVTDARSHLDVTQLTLALDVALTAAMAAIGGIGGAIELAIEEGQAPSTLRITLSDTGTTPDRQVAVTGGGRIAASRETALAVADLVARRHRGRAGSNERAGIGGRLWIELPRAPARDAAAPAPAVSFRRGAVLVADDEEMVRSSLAAAVRAAGLEAVEASNGREALELVLESPGRFALVVLDLVMPVMDGREALGRIRDVSPALPVVVCTGYDPAGDGELARADLLIKPFSIEEFLTKIGEMLSRPVGHPAQGDTIKQ